MIRPNTSWKKSIQSKSRSSKRKSKLGEEGALPGGAVRCDLHSGCGELQTKRVLRL